MSFSLCYSSAYQFRIKGEEQWEKVVHVGFLVMVSMLFVGCASSTAEEIEINEDKVPSIDSKESSEGTMIQLVKESVSSGDILLIDFVYPAMASESVKIRYRSGLGTLKMTE
ncbi:hypothetical protein [Enterococcus caccae]|nr:hypothetical protein [Enterococcus caccae]